MICTIYSSKCNKDSGLSVEIASFGQIMGPRKGTMLEVKDKYMKEPSIKILLTQIFRFVQTVIPWSTVVPIESSKLKVSHLSEFSYQGQQGYNASWFC